MSLDMLNQAVDMHAYLEVHIYLHEKAGVGCILEVECM